MYNLYVYEVKTNFTNGRMRFGEIYKGYKLEKVINKLTNSLFVKY